MMVNEFKDQKIPYVKIDFFIKITYTNNHKKHSEIGSTPRFESTQTIIDARTMSNESCGAMHQSTFSTHRNTDLSAALGWAVAKWSIQAVRENTSPSFPLESVLFCFNRPSPHRVDKKCFYAISLCLKRDPCGQNQTECTPPSPRVHLRYPGRLVNSLTHHMPLTWR